MLRRLGGRYSIYFFVLTVFVLLEPSIKTSHIRGDIVLELKDQPELIPARVSWYGEEFHGRSTASGEKFDMNLFSVAHTSIPFGTRVRFLNPITDKWCDATVNDSGPFDPGSLPNLEPHPRRQFDASKALAKCLGFVDNGIADLYVIGLPNKEPLTHKEVHSKKIIRSDDRFISDCSDSNRSGF